MKNKLLIIALICLGLIGSIKSQTLIKDINPGTGSSNPRNFIELPNGTAYFWAEVNGDYRIFKSDRTTSGTNVIPDANGSSLGIFLEGTDRLYYSSRSSGSSVYNLCYLSLTNDSIHNCQLIGNTSINFDFYQLFEYQKEIYLTANYQGDFGMFKFNETNDQFDLIVDHHGFQRPPLEMNGLLYYGWADSLFSFDGTNSTFIKNSISVSNGFFFNTAVVDGSTFYFLDDLRTEVWKSDGTSSGTIKLQIPNLGTSPSIQLGEPVVNATGFYTIGNVQTGPDFKTYLFSNATTNLLDTAIRLETGLSSSQSETRLLRATNNLIFWRREFDIEVSDGTPTGTSILGTFGSGNLTKPTMLTSSDNKLYFAALDQQNGYELIETDGNIGGTIVYDINPGPGSSMFDPKSAIRIRNGRVYLAATDGTSGVEPFYLNQNLSSFEKQRNRSAINIYPNPTSNMVFINSSERINSLDLFDIRGKCVPMEIFEENGIFEIRTKYSGFTILKINSDSGISTKKIFFNP